MAKQKKENPEARADGLDERKLKILHAVIRNYLETGEPVGSRTISKYTDLNLSSATIRNEMSDLEELGFIDVVVMAVPARVAGYRSGITALYLRKRKEAVKYFKAASDMGNKVAMYYMGICYEIGNGVPKDYNTAKQYYSKSGFASLPSRDF